MTKLALAGFFAWISLAPSLQAQCPNSSRPGVHVVKKGETLYSIARQYDQNVADLCAWNNIKIGDVLHSCEELAVSAQSVTAGSEKVNSVATRQSTTTKTREAEVRNFEFDMKELPASEQETRRVETPLAEKTRESAPVEFRETSKAAPQPVRYVKQPNELHVVRRGESVAALAQLYGYTEERFREFNGFGEREEVTEGQHVRSNDCVCNGQAAPTREKWSEGRPASFSDDAAKPETPVTHDAAKKETKKAASEGNNKASDSESWNDKEAMERAAEPTGQNKPAEKQADKTTANTTGSGMRSKELAMLDEINLVRRDPLGYVPHVEEFIVYLRANWGGQGISAARELIDELKRTPTLPQLEASECLYRAAKKHGDYFRETGKELDHFGRNNSMIGDRIDGECPNFTGGSENLSLGVSDTRKIILWLLVDNGLPDRGHRKNLLNPKFRYCACYDAGTIGDWSDNWVQNFGH